MSQSNARTIHITTRNDDPRAVVVPGIDVVRGDPPYIHLQAGSTHEYGPLELSSIGKPPRITVLKSKLRLIDGIAELAGSNGGRRRIVGRAPSNSVLKYLVRSTTSSDVLPRDTLPQEIVLYEGVRALWGNVQRFLSAEESYPNGQRTDGLFILEDESALLTVTEMRLVCVVGVTKRALWAKVPTVRELYEVLRLFFHVRVQALQNPDSNRDQLFRAIDWALHSMIHLATLLDSEDVWEELLTFARMRTRVDVRGGTIEAVEVFRSLAPRHIASRILK